MARRPGAPPEGFGPGPSREQPGTAPGICLRWTDSWQPSPPSRVHRVGTPLVSSGYPRFRGWGHGQLCGHADECGKSVWVSDVPRVLGVRDLVVLADWQKLPQPFRNQMEER